MIFFSYRALNIQDLWTVACVVTWYSLSCAHIHLFWGFKLLIVSAEWSSNGSWPNVSFFWSPNPGKLKNSHLQRGLPPLQGLIAHCVWGSFTRGSITYLIPHFSKLQHHPFLPKAPFCVQSLPVITYNTRSSILYGILRRREWDWSQAQLIEPEVGDQIYCELKEQWL